MLIHNFNNQVINYKHKELIMNNKYNYYYKVKLIINKLIIVNLV